MQQTATTNGVTIAVETQYEAQFSHKGPDPKWVFSYHIQIMNQSAYTLQLLRRYWEITDLLEGTVIVAGDGVVGFQPVLEPGESHQYVSACHLNSPVGRMKGHYVMEKAVNGQLIKVTIPEFALIAPQLLN